MAGTIRGPGYRARAKLISSSFTGQNDITTRCYLKTAVPVIKTGRMTEQMVTCGKNGSHMRWEVSRLGVVTGRLPGQAPGEELSTQQLCLGSGEGVARDKVAGYSHSPGPAGLLATRGNLEFTSVIFEDTENVLSRGSPRPD